MRCLCVVLFATLTVFSRSTLAQENADTTYVILPTNREIALARSAAPANVSADASIWVVRDGEYRIAHHGTNANHCFVARTWPESLEPVCYDAEGARTILRIEVRRFELRRTGLNQDELDEAIDREIAAGVLPIPERPAMSYMMSSAQVLFNDQGQPAGNWRPHLMLYMPHVTDEDIGVTGAPMEYLQVANPGEPTAYVIIVVPDFVNPTSR